MAINNINESYTKTINSIKSNVIRNVDNTTNDKLSSATSNLTDTLELTSSESDLSTYLNYSSSGNYSLAAYLNEDSNSSNNEFLFDSDSLSTKFKEITDAKTQEIDNLIEKALSKKTE